MENETKKQLNIKDLARLAGVSTSTVSNALSGRRHVKPATKQKILELAQQYHYQPSVMARGLCRQKTKIIGVITADLYNPYYTEVIKGIDAQAKQLGYTIVIGSTNYDDYQEMEEFRKLNALCVDGFIIIGSQNTHFRFSEINSRKVPLVFVDREVKNHPSVLIDNKAAMMKAVDYLCSLRHKKIAYVGYQGTNIINLEKRLEGYKAGLKKNGLAFNSKICLLSNALLSNEFNVAYGMLDTYLKNNGCASFSALIGEADIIAFGCMRALQDNHVKVPGQVSVVGFDNIHSSKFSNPRLTTVNQPKKKMGKIGAKMLFSAIEGHRKINTNSVYLKTVIVERESAGLA